MAYADGHALRQPILTRACTVLAVPRAHTEWRLALVLPVWVALAADRQGHACSSSVAFACKNKLCGAGGGCVGALQHQMQPAGKVGATQCSLSLG
jgi:hypothetical protein